MKIRLVLVSVICIFILLNCKNTATVPLAEKWKFTTGDSNVYALPDFDDSGWKEITSANTWESQGFPDYNGIAWYRQKVKIPRTLLEESYKESGIKLILGKIDDADEVYLNGIKIGGFGKFPPEMDVNSYDIMRIYILNFDDPTIKWDSLNTIAVRVYDHSGTGGLSVGPYKIEPITIEDLLRVQKDTAGPIAIEPGKELKKKLYVKNMSSSIDMEVSFNVTVFSIDDQPVYQTTIEKHIAHRQTVPLEFSFKPKADKTLRANYKITAANSDFVFEKTDLIGYVTQKKEWQPVRPVIKNIMKNVTEPFGVENCRLDGYLGERININIEKRLMRVDEKALLEGFYNRPGSHPWIGEHIGKFLNAAVNSYRYSHNEELKNKITRMADILIGSQDNDGYLGTYSKENRWTSWDVWSHKYNLIGLLNYYSVSGYQPALLACRKMGNLLCEVFGTKSGQRDIIASGTHVGMASTSILESMVMLYRYTGDKKYLDFCHYIIDSYEQKNGPKIISTLTTCGQVEKTANAKAYEMLSNLVGILQLYKVTHEDKLIKAVNNAWDDVVKNHLYITGSTSSFEHFHEDSLLPADRSDHICEGCVTTTWMQLNVSLYYLLGEQKYLDQIEKTIYNHLLGAENPQSGCVSYYTGLQGCKDYHCGITCCLSSVPRGIALIPFVIWTRNNDEGLTIASYNPGKLYDEITTKDGTKVKVNMTVESDYPVSGKISIHVQPDQEKEFSVWLRVPEWTKSFTTTIGDKKYPGKPGEFLIITRYWKSDNISIELDMNDRFVDGGKSYPDYIAFLHGPQVLALDSSLNLPVKKMNKITANNPVVLPQLTAVNKSPLSWYGNEFFPVQLNEDKKTRIFTLVPFAEAGQTFAPIRVWIKK